MLWWQSLQVLMPTYRAVSAWLRYTSVSFFSVGEVVVFTSSVHDEKTVAAKTIRKIRRMKREDKKYLLHVLGGTLPGHAGGLPTA
jgi:NADPH-dependent curcumin reductase CurA